MTGGGIVFNGLDGLDVAGKNVLLRVDLNVPMRDGRITDMTRIERVTPTIRELAGKGARVALLAHFDRPGGKVVPSTSLAPLAEALSRVLGVQVSFAADCVGAAAAAVVGGLGDGDVALLENLRFHPGEEANDPAFAAELAKLGVLYVNDAFSAAHRAHASIEGITHLLPAYAGRGMQAELEALRSTLENPARPLAALVGGAKVSTKLALLENLTGRVDKLIIGGGMANTFLHAKGVKVGKSLCERDMADTARAILAAAKANGCDILLPIDAVVAPGLEAGNEAVTVAIDAVPDDAMILDVGSETVHDLILALGACRSLMWNGPLGAFEFPPFDAGTNAVARAVAEMTVAGGLLSVAGGGDTVAALAHAGVQGDFSYVSTAGGAFLEWIEGKQLPGVAALARAAQ